MGNCRKEDVSLYLVGKPCKGFSVPCFLKQLQGVASALVSLSYPFYSVFHCLGVSTGKACNHDSQRCSTQDCRVKLKGGALI